MSQTESLEYQQPLINKLMNRGGIETKDSWDETNRLSERVRNSLTEITGTLLQGREILENTGSMTGEAKVLVNSILKDVEESASGWKRERERHVGKKGPIKNQDEFQLSNDIGAGYIQIHERLLNASAYSAPRLQELVTECEQKLRNQIALEEKSEQPTEKE